MANKKPENTSSLEEFVNSGDNTTITYHTTSFLERVGNIRFPVFNVLDDYMDELESLASDVEVTDEVRYRYAYRPRLLAQEVYGNGELYFVILRLNSICDMKEFTLSSNTFKMVKKEVLIDFLKQVYKAEKKEIDKYNEKESENSI